MTQDDLHPNVMRALPATHLTQIKVLSRGSFKQAGSSETSSVAGQFDPDKGEIISRALPGIETLADQGLQNVNLFNFSLRHEIGHAVDNLLMKKHKSHLTSELASQAEQVKYFSRLPDSSDADWQWIYYQNNLTQEPANFSHMIEEMMNQSTPPMALPLNFSPKDFKYLLFYKTNKHQKNYNEKYTHYLKALADSTGVSQKSLSRQLENHPVCQALTNTSALESPFSQDFLHKKTTFGDRVFVRPYDNQFASFSAKAFPLRLTRYCTRGPTEWFAEAYTLYNDPKGRSVLEKKHPAGARHLESLLTNAGLELETK